MIKRRIAAALATFLMLQNPLGVMASYAGSPAAASIPAAKSRSASRSATPADADKDSEENADDRDISGITTGSGRNDDDTASRSEARTAGSGKGILNIELSAVIPSQDVEWNIELTNTNKQNETIDVVTGNAALEWSGDGGEAVTAVFTEELENGKWNLRMEPIDDNSPYIPYEQKGIRINNNVVTLKLMNDVAEAYGYSEEDAQNIGLLLLGDMNGDGDIDADDCQELLHSIALADAGEDDGLEAADLNGDGEINLLDASVFAKFYHTKKRTAVPASALLVTEEDFHVASVSNAAANREISEFLSDRGESGSLVMTANDGQEISETNPITLTSEFAEAKTMEGFSIDPVMGSPDTILDADIEVEYIENGSTRTKLFRFSNGEADTSLKKLKRALRASDELPTEGKSLVVDLGGQVAVKKITITVKKTMSEEPTLVEIAKVEFLEDMASKIPEPQLSIPDKLQVDNGDAEFTVKWRKQPNVTGYAVTVSGINADKKDVTEEIVTEENSLNVNSLKGADLKNGEKYTVTVRSVNGSWKSGISETVYGEPEAISLPPAPENIVITPGYKRLLVSWKEMKDTDVYNLYYRIAGDQEAEFAKVEHIQGTTYEISGLKDMTEYELYLTGTNRLGEGAASSHYTAKTASLNPPITPNYKLINTLDEDAELSSHIESVNNSGGTVKGSWDIVDGNYETAWVRLDWDSGCTYPGDGKAPVVTFDDVYTMDTFVIVPDLDQASDYYDIRLDYWPEGVSEGGKQSVKGSISKKSSNGKTYYVFETAEPVTAKSVSIAISTWENRISIAELKFYDYDSIEDEIDGLYADQFHVSLADGVDEQKIAGLRERVNTPDEVSGEYHPKKTVLETELKNAEDLLADKNLQAEILQVDNKDAARADGHITFRGGLNTFQPLGVSVSSGETITVYVGGQDKLPGENTSVQLVMAQYHGTSSAWKKEIGTLKAGPNTITIPAVDDMNEERGGQLYVVYTGAKGKENYGVRVSGGTRIPVLDLSDEFFSDPSKNSETKDVRLEKITKYIEALDEMQAAVEEKHMADHQGDHKLTHKDYDWDPKTCIYEASDIVTRYSMLSLSTEQVLNGLGEGTAEERAEKLDQSLQAMDQMIYLFYQHKGLNDTEGTRATDLLPVGRLNIRYQTMFAGAFMYAGGEHIGIEWDSLPGMVTGVPIAADENGKRESGQWFGWGIAHEIGHEINEGAYAVAEVTNNYFSLLADSDDDNNKRFSYDTVFAKVTSGSQGKASDVFIQLAMYWQLHLAYDLDGYNYKTYENSQEQLENLIFARMDSYVRNKANAPSPDGITIDLNTDTDNKLMQLAVAAAEKDCLDFFRHWGLTPNERTQKYAAQFPKETRGIWFANDENRAEQMEAEKTPGETENSAEISGQVAYTSGSNAVTLEINGGDENWIYEIYRYERIKGSIERRSIGYTHADEDGSAEFTDIIGTVNNRAFTYEAVGYDLWLNPTPRTEIGSVKVEHDGTLSAKSWTVSTNLTNDELEGPNEFHPDSSEQPGLDAMIDGVLETGFVGVSEMADPEIIIHLNSPEIVTGLTYKADSAEGRITDFAIYVSEDGVSWEKVHTGGVSAFNETAAEDAGQTIYFNDGTNLYTYDAAYVKIEAVNQKGKTIGINEISLKGQTGDNVDLDADGFGRLKADYPYGAGDGQVIPAGSIVFTGTYKGNPAYNAVLLWDEQGNMVAGADSEAYYADQVILAPDPGNGMLGEVSEGRWIYWIDAAYADSFLEKNVQAVRAELYRVDDAVQMTGERLTSSTLLVDVSNGFPELELISGTTINSKYRTLELSGNPDASAGLSELFE